MGGVWVGEWRCATGVVGFPRLMCRRGPEVVVLWVGLGSFGGVVPRVGLPVLCWLGLVLRWGWTGYGGVLSWCPLFVMAGLVAVGVVVLSADGGSSHIGSGLAVGSGVHWTRVRTDVGAGYSRTTTIGMLASHFAIRRAMVAILGGPLPIGGCWVVVWLCWWFLLWVGG